MNSYGSLSTAIRSAENVALVRRSAVTAMGWQPYGASELGAFDDAVTSALQWGIVASNGLRPDAAALAHVDTEIVKRVTAEVNAWKRAQRAQGARDEDYRVQVQDPTMRPHVDSVVAHRHTEREARSARGHAAPVDAESSADRLALVMHDHRKAIRATGPQELARLMHDF